MSQMRGFYIISVINTEDIYKIGFTQNTNRRRLELQRKLKIKLEVLYFRQFSTCREVETSIKRKFKHARVYQTEWLLLNGEDLQEIKILAHASFEKFWDSKDIPTTKKPRKCKI